MKPSRRLPLLACALAACALVSAAAARPDRLPAPDDPARALAAPAPEVSATLAAGDTLYLLGGPDRPDGDFQDDAFPQLPSDDGWRPYQAAEPPLWHVDTFNAALLDPGTPGNHAMWCGRLYPPCGGEAENPGYGANLDESLVWSGTAPDPQDTTVVRVTAVLNYDMEPGYDYLTLERLEPEGYTVVATWNGTNKAGGVFAPETVDETFAVPPSLYQGPGADEIRLRWRFTADGGFNDQDCIFPTDGAAQVDDIVVSFDHGSGPVVQTQDDFEPGSPVSWTATQTYACNDGAIWSGLEAPVPCGAPNTTPQLAFLADGTGCSDTPVHGTQAAYGPDGLVTDCGSLTWHRAEWVSPSIALPDMTYWETIVIEADVFVHQLESGGPWGVFAARVSEDAGASWTQWMWERYMGNTLPARGRFRRIIHRPDLRFPAVDRLQVSLGARQYYYVPCSEGTPAPWYDNVAVKVIRHAGPQLSAEGSGEVAVVAVDAFPAGGVLDPADPGSNPVRVKGPGRDELTVLAAFPRRGAAPLGTVEMHWVLRPNPLFDAFRGNPPPNPVPGTDEGPVSGTPTYDTSRYAFSLPATGFVYPGDELHYYFRVQDDVAGDVGTAIFPADTTGYGRFEAAATGLHASYPGLFHFRALPSLRAAHPDSQPGILVWDDTGDRTFSTYVMRSLAQLGYRAGRDYDVYRSGGSPGGSLFDDATVDQLAGYDTLVYGCGGQQESLGYGSLAVFEAWLALGGRNLLFMGDNLLEGTSTAYGLGLLATYLGAELADGWVRPLIDDQVMPRVEPTGAVAGLATPLVADGCTYADFDAVAPVGAGQAVLAFTGPDGAPASYPYAAGVYHEHAATGTRSVLLPVAFEKLATPADHPGGLSARTTFLDEVLTLFGHAGQAAPSAAAPPARFAIRSAPNPFNPRTRITWEMPRAGHLSVAVYDVKGRRVRTLVDRDVPAGAGRADWDGTDDLGRAVASGVYFRVSEAMGDRQVAKMTLVR